MNKIFDSFVQGVQFGEIQQNGALAVLPVLADLPFGPDYLTLQEALAAGTITITEITEGGSVPELAVTNNGDLPVLLLDGEELAGAKQNRVVNTTILLKEHSKTVIPVSCVEHGRWNYASREFKDSGNVMAANLRAMKCSSVSFCLNETGERRSDQGEVWDGVAEMVDNFDVTSSTGAMTDIYTHVEKDITSLLRAFAPVPGQRGMVVLINGKVIGMEYISQPRAFAKVFDKLLRSYALDALQVKKPKETVINANMAQEFLTTFAKSDIKSYDALGYGREHRVTGNTSAGSALTVEETMIHLSLLATKKDKPGRGRRNNEERGEVPFPRSYWVHNNDFLAGCFPGAPELPDAIRKLSWLLDAGIRRVINLMEPEETDHQGRRFESYEPVLTRLAAERGIEVDCVRIPIPDQCVTTRETMRRILDTIDESIENDMSVYVHCWGGKGRTGTVVGCWLARNGIANGMEALERVQYLRRHDPTADQPSPENRIQCNMVRNWQEGE
jgi:hypothetical protein